MTKPNKQSINGLIIKDQLIIFDGKTSYNSKGKEWLPRYLLKCMNCENAIEVMLDKLDLRTIKNCKCNNASNNNKE